MMNHRAHPFSLSRQLMIGLLTAIGTALGTLAVPDGVRAETAPAQAVQVFHASAKTLSPLLAQSCTETSWQAFSVAVQAANYVRFEFKDSYDVWTSRTGLKLDISGTTEKVDIALAPPSTPTTGSKGAKPITLSVDGHHYSGTDACEIIAAYLKDAPTFDDKAAAVATGAALAGVSQLPGSRAPADLPAVATAMFLSTDSARQKPLRLDLDRIMAANYTVRCSDQFATLQTAAHKIVVHHARGHLADVNVFDKESDIAINQDRQSIFALQARRYLSVITASCKKTKDAEKLQQIAGDTIDDAQARGAGLAPVGGDRQPAGSQ